jgi:hypothetical protein
MVRLGQLAQQALGARVRRAKLQLGARGVSHGGGGGGGGRALECRLGTSRAACGVVRLPLLPPGAAGALVLALSHPRPVKRLPLPSGEGLGACSR